MPRPPAQAGRRQRGRPPVRDDDSEALGAFVDSETDAAGPRKLAADAARPEDADATRLLGRLVEIARANGVHSLIAAVSGANPAAVAFHEREGFRIVGRIPEAGRKFERWLDLVLLQRLL